MSASMKANRNMYLLNAPISNSADRSEDSEGDFRGTFSDCPTVFRAGFSEPCSSGTVRKRAPIRRRPPRAQRQRNLVPLPIEDKTLSGERREGKQEVGSRKRKKKNQGDTEISTNKAQFLTVIPNEGIPSS